MQQASPTTELNLINLKPFASSGVWEGAPKGSRRLLDLRSHEITPRIKAAGLNGALKKWNTRYRQYRLAQVEKREPAVPYATFLEQFVITPTVRSVAMAGRAI